MARIRTIKPELWTDEKFGALDSHDQLVFIGLISQADDAGRLIDSVRLIDGALFPYDDSRTVRESLRNLSRTGLIRRGETESKQPVIQIVGWDRHQRVDKPNLKAALRPISSNGNGLPDIRESVANDSGMIREPFAPHTNDQRPTTYDQRAVVATPATALRGLYGWEGSEGTDPILLKAFAEPGDRDRCLLIAIQRLEAEGKDPTSNQRVFRKVLETVVSQQREAVDDFSHWDDV